MTDQKDDGSDQAQVSGDYSDLVVLVKLVSPLGERRAAEESDHHFVIMEADIQQPIWYSVRGDLADSS
jgi:hypothetical protein